MSELLNVKKLHNNVWDSTDILIRCLIYNFGKLGNQIENIIYNPICLSIEHSIKHSIKINIKKDILMIKLVLSKKDGANLPIKSWASELEESAIKQAVNLANLPFTFKYVALMPDCHLCYGMPVGGVLATKDVIIPNAVGVDIGCGMSFCQTNIPVSILYETKDKQNRNLVKCMIDTISRNVPVGFGKHKTPQEWIGFQSAPDIDIIQSNLMNASISLGTLGGGNHFIELQQDTKGNLCIMLHSGSRNLGKQICDYYNKIAISLNEKWFSSVTKDKELAFLPINSCEGHEYKVAMDFALDFAKQNRQHMMEKIKNICFNLIKKHIGNISKTILNEVNAHHNYAIYENHFGQNVIVHRKGAIRARKNDIGIIPGSMETASYIVRGLGNAESFNSASHGAGRIMSRKKAKSLFSVNDMVKRLKDKNIILNCKNKNDVIDECGLAYKNIDEVIENENDLVEVIESVTQIGVVKG